MQSQIIEEKEFTIIGISARTSNAQEMGGQGIIGNQWNRFFSESILSKISNKADSNILAIYTDYENDRNGEYIFILGVKVMDESIIPEGMISKKIPGGKYAKFSSTKGPVGTVVMQAWQNIWGMEDKNSLGGKRAYKSDYEVYDDRSSDLQNAIVDLHIGIK
jgi:predicted transcriptional regulator YdeE